MKDELKNACARRMIFGIGKGSQRDVSVKLDREKEATRSVLMAKKIIGKKLLLKE